jgi:hypothetical protein
MPLFGNRIVVGTANVKHIKEFKDDISQRECALAEWEVERAKRKDKLEVLQTQIILSRRNSDISQRSALKNLGEADSNQGYRNSLDNTEIGENSGEIVQIHLQCPTRKMI